MLLLTVKGDSDVKQGFDLNPVRDSVMQFGRKPTIEQGAIVSNSFERFKVGRPLPWRAVALAKEARAMLNKYGFAA